MELSNLEYIKQNNFNIDANEKTTYYSLEILKKYIYKTLAKWKILVEQ